MIRKMVRDWLERDDVSESQLLNMTLSLGQVYQIANHRKKAEHKKEGLNPKPPKPSIEDMIREDMELEEKKNPR